MGVSVDSDRCISGTFAFHLVRALPLYPITAEPYLTDPERGADMVSVNEWRKPRKMNTEEAIRWLFLILDGTLLDTLTDLADSHRCSVTFLRLAATKKDEVRRFVGMASVS